MLRTILKKFGYLHTKEAERNAEDRAIQAVAQIEGMKPGDELINASRVLRKYGFRIVYALGDGEEKKHALQLAEHMSHPASIIDKSRMINQFLPNIKIVDDKSLLS